MKVNEEMSDIEFAFMNVTREVSGENDDEG